VPGYFTGEPEVALVQQRPTPSALWEADPELRALEPKPGDLIEERRRVGPETELFDIDVVPEDRDRPDRNEREGIPRPAKSLTQVRAKGRAHEKCILPVAFR
jgi:hypothetical protein